MIGRMYQYPNFVTILTMITESVQSFVRKMRAQPDVVKVHPKQHTVDLVTVDGVHIPVEADERIYSPTIVHVYMRKEKFGG